MYKLVVVGGKLRGEEFILKEGENVLGRSDECDIPFPVQGVSKKHLSITVAKDAAYIKDLGSSNGTFLNGKIIKRATAKTGDKIALPDSILQVVFVEEKKTIIKKKINNDDEDESEDEFYKGGDAPDNIFGKLLHAFKYKLMPVLHGINEEYEWRHLFGILLTVATFVTITLTIIPVLRDNRLLLLEEIQRRGMYYADEIARTNSRALEQRNLNSIIINFLDDPKTGIKSYELFDSEGRIFRPREKLNEYIDDPFSIQTRDWALRTANQGGEDIFSKSLGGGEIGIGRKITAYNPRLGTSETVGIVAFRFIPESIQVEKTRSQKSYLEAIVKSLVVSAFLFGLIYYLTMRPVEELRFQIEEALRGKRRNLESKYLMNELGPLRNSINSILQRLRELQDTSEGEFAEIESDEGYVATLREFMMGGGVPAMVLNSEKNLWHINTEAEDLTAIRESSSQGLNILDICREKGFAATIIELCDNSANNGGTFQEGEYELQGNPHKICVVSLMGKDNFAKAFYVTFIKD